MVAFRHQSREETVPISETARLAEEGSGSRRTERLRCTRSRVPVPRQHDNVSARAVRHNSQEELKRILAKSWKLEVDHSADASILHHFASVQDWRESLTGSEGMLAMMYIASLNSPPLDDPQECKHRTGWK